MHGDMAQSARTETLARFKAGEITLLVATDVAGRGLDVVGLSHVFNFDVPIHAEDYVHRIGRTGRAGREGRAFTLATRDDHKFVSAITRLIGKSIPDFEVPGAPVIDATAEAAADDAGPRDRRAKRGRDRKRGGRRDERGHAEDRRPTSGNQPREPHHEPVAAAPSHHDEQGTTTARHDRDKPQRERHRDRNERRARPERDRTERRDRRDRNDRDDRPVLSFGDHMPSFMQRPIRKVSEQV
jgi:superfamily II DNA/RNA helicase